MNSILAHALDIGIPSIKLYQLRHQLPHLILFQPTDPRDGFLADGCTGEPVRSKVGEVRHLPKAFSSFVQVLAASLEAVQG